MAKVLLADAYPPTMVERIRAAFPAAVRFAALASASEADFARLAGDADGLLVVHRRVDAALLALAPRVRFVQRTGIGYDNLDLAALRAHGVLAAYCPGGNAAAVAEHTILLMLALLKRLIAAHEATRARAWPQGVFVAAGYGDLDGRTWG